MIFHFVAHAIIGQKPLADADAARWLWRRLRKLWPHALAACLMPNHVHLIIETRAPEQERMRLAHVLGALSRRLRAERTWITAPPARVGDRKALARQIRYVHLNPCRAGLADDPVSWTWSTHRGAIGAEVDPWVSPERLAAALGLPREGFEEWLQRYVSGDPSVLPEGTPLPRVLPRREVPEVPLGAIVAAAAAATPWSPKSTQRKTIVQLARHQGWTKNEVVARAAGIHVSMVSRYALHEDEALLSPALLCLADARLRALTGRVGDETR